MFIENKKSKRDPKPLHYSVLGAGRTETPLFIFFLSYADNCMPKVVYRQVEIVIAPPHIRCFREDLVEKAVDLITINVKPNQ